MVDQYIIIDGVRRDIVGLFDILPKPANYFFKHD